MDGLLECSPFGEYRLKGAEAREIDFKKALHTPGVALGDTTIIKLEDVKNGAV
jgi:hypothetical protein